MCKNIVHLKAYNSLTQPSLFKLQELLFDRMESVFESVFFPRMSAPGLLILCILFVQDLSNPPYYFSWSQLVKAGPVQIAKFMLGPARWLKNTSSFSCGFRLQSFLVLVQFNRAIQPTKMRSKLIYFKNSQTSSLYFFLFTKNRNENSTR